MPKSIDEQIADTKLKITQEENHLNLLINKHKEAVRKARTRRLIERGAILENLIPGAEFMSNDEVKALLVSVLPREIMWRVPPKAEQK